jgi:hypothetical protein
MEMRDACGINLIMERGVLHASKERKRISEIQDSLVFQKIVLGYVKCCFSLS